MKTSSENHINRHWLVFANAKRCNHYASLVETGFISWKKARNNFAIGDIVYVFSSAERKIIFKTVVTAIEERSDSKFWVENAPKDITWRLEAIQEFTGDTLDEDSLKKYGFKGGRSLQHPMCNNPELFEYIEEQFDNCH